MIKDEFEPYKDKYRLVHPSIGSISANSIRFTTEYLFSLYLNNQLTDADRNEISIALQLCEKKPGLLQRHPEKYLEDQESVDDTIARLAASQVLSDGFAKRFLDYGRLPQNTLGIEYVYNNRDESKFTFDSWLGRQQAIIAQAQIVVGERIPILRRFFLWVSLIIAAFDKSQDNKVLSWFIVRTYLSYKNLKRDFITDFIVYFWKEMFKKQYPNGVGQVLEAYYGKLPASKWLMDVF